MANRRSVPHKHPSKMPPEVEEKILHLRRQYHLGPIRIVWYLERFHGIKVSDAGVYRTLKRHGLNRLPRGTRLRKVHTQRYNKQVPGHHIQMDVKFPIFKTLRRGATAIEGSAASLQTSAFGSCGQSKSQNDRPNAGLFRGRCRYRVREASPRHCRVTAGSGHSDYPTFLLIIHMRDNSIKINAIRPSRCTSPG